MEKKKNSILIAVYGSLRENEYNYNSFKRQFGDGFIKVGQQQISGFGLYSLGSYPGILKEEGALLVVDLIECSQECYDRIDRMELGAGYENIIVETQKGPATIYLYKHTPRGGKVLSGDWCKRHEQTSIIQPVDF